MNQGTAWIRLFIGLVANALVLCLPIAGMWGAGFAVDPIGVGVFLALATLFCVADLSREFYPADSAAAGECWKHTKTSTPCANDRPFCAGDLWISQAEQVDWFDANRQSSFASGIGTLGVVLFVAGAVLRWWSIAALQRFFVSETYVSQQQPLVDWGPYRFIRHPSETGILLATLGSALLSQSVIAGVIWVLGLLPLVIYRVLLEEQGLIQGLGNCYTDYQKRVRRLLPFVY
ncbi:MAG: isoprenylcysteine carboxylmethyltransferase family protein [Pirellulales bacterium]